MPRWSLYGLALGAPYLHQGGARTLAELFDDPKWKVHAEAGSAVWLHQGTAEGYATGRDVGFNLSTPSLHTAAHEAAHVVQQRAEIQLKGGVGQVGDLYEERSYKSEDKVTTPGKTK